MPSAPDGVASTSGPSEDGNSKMRSEPSSRSRNTPLLPARTSSARTAPASASPSAVNTTAPRTTPTGTSHTAVPTPPHPAVGQLGTPPRSAVPTATSTATCTATTTATATPLATR